MATGFHRDLVENNGQPRQYSSSIFRDTEVATSAWEPRYRAPVQSCPEREILLIWQLRTTKFRVKVANLDRIIDTLWRCKTWQDSGYNHTHVKTSRETEKSLQKFLEPTRKPRVIYTDISLEIGKSCEELAWNHCTSTHRGSEKHRIAERAALRVKEGTSAVLLQSGLGNELVGRFYGMLFPSAKHARFLSDVKTPFKRLFGMPSHGPATLLEPKDLSPLGKGQGGKKGKKGKGKGDKSAKPKEWPQQERVLELLSCAEEEICSGRQGWSVRWFGGGSWNRQEKTTFCEGSVAILAQAVSCSNVRGVVPVHELFWFVLSKCLQPCFCSFPSFLMARVSDGTDVPVSPTPASSSEMRSPCGSLPDLDGTGFRACTMEETINETFIQIAKVPHLMQSFFQVGKLRPDAFLDSGFIWCKNHKIWAHR